MLERCRFEGVVVDRVSVVNPRDPDVRRTVIKLVRYLRDMTEQSRSEILHLKDCEGVWWLSGLPEPVMMRDSPDRNNVLLKIPHVSRPSVPKIPSELEQLVDLAQWADPDVAEPVLMERTENGTEENLNYSLECAYQRALSDRENWVHKIQQVKPRQELHARFTRIARQLAQQDDQYELVLASGLVTGPGPNEEPVARHLITQRLTLRVNAEDLAVEVGVDSDAMLQVEDRRFLLSMLGDRFSLVDNLRQEMEDSDWLPHQEGIEKLLAAWSDRMLPDSPPFAPIRTEPSSLHSPQLRVTISPALVLRRKGRSPIIAFFDEMQQQLLRDTSLPVPLSLVQVLHTLEIDQRRAWLEASGIPSGDILGDDPLFPHEYNEEQLHVLQQLRTDNGVVVQGPPGTGKTHTITNLIAALLAVGLRVLVVSQREQPLRVLRDKLPEGLRDLCISFTGAGRRGTGELDASVRSMANHVTKTDEHRTALRSAELLGHRAAVQRRITEIEADLARLRDTEHHRHGQVSDGYSGCLAEIAEKVVGLADRFSWFPPLATDSAGECPLSVAELVDLRKLLLAQDGHPDRCRDVVPDTPDGESPEVLGQLFTAIMSPQVNETTQRLADSLITVEDSTLARWAEHVERLLAVCQYLRAHEAHGHEWLALAVEELLASRRVELWRELFGYKDTAIALHQRSRAAHLREVRIADPDSDRWPMLHRQATDLCGGLDARKQLRRWGFETTLAKNTAAVRSSAVFRGNAPETLEAATAVRDYLEINIEIVKLSRLWDELIELSSPSLPVNGQLSWLCSAAEHLEHLMNLDRLVCTVRGELSHHGVLAVLVTEHDWRKLIEAIVVTRHCHAAQAQQARYDEILARWRRQVSVENAAPETCNVLIALQRADLEGYRSAIDELVQACAVIARHRHRHRLAERLREAHPALAADLESTFYDTVWISRFAELNQAWAWSMALRFVRDQDRPGLDAQREAELASTQAQLREATAALAVEQAWGHCLQRMSAQQMRALRDYQSYVRKEGLGRGSHTSTYQRSARDAIRIARECVPAWIMPISRVAEMLPPAPNSFDVVIVDEASQAAVNSLFLLWLAPRLIVVGDDRQCTPGGGSRPLDEAWTRLRSDFPEITESVRNKLAPHGHLYDILTSAFPRVIRLQEHFRCMPEIIRWPSEEFYGGELVPLRQYGADRLEPVIIRELPDGRTQGIGEKIYNLVEAEYITDRLCDCLADHRYKDKTFGVITLQGHYQRRVIEKLLDKRVTAKDHLERKISVGEPADFQGDERSVIFLSTVASGATQMRRDERFRQAVNVAVTRAEDQLWIVTSLNVQQLQREDLRHKMLSGFGHLQETSSARTRTEILPIPQKHMFSCPFHEQVYRIICARGFTAEINVTVGNRKLDIVVRGATTSVIVACDWSSGADHNQRQVEATALRELRRAKWPFCRVMHSYFVLDPDEAMEQVWQTLTDNNVTFSQEA